MNGLMDWRQRRNFEIQSLRRGDKGPRWRRDALKACAGLLGNHRWLSQKLRVSRNAAAEGTLKSWRAALITNARVIRAKIERSKP